MTTVQQVFTGDASQLQREYEKLARSNARLEGQMNQLVLSSQKAGSLGADGIASIERAAGGAMRQVGQIVAGYLSLDAVISAVNASIQDSIELQTKAFDTKSALGKSQAMLALNVLDDAELKRVAPQISQIAQEQQFPGLDKLTEATAEAISAAGGDIELALKGVRTSAGLARLTPETLRPLTGATIDAARASGATTDEAAALVLSAGKTGRVVDPRQQADVFGKGIGGIVASSRGDRKQAAEQAAEAIAAITVLMGDKMGDRSTTAAMSLSAQMDKFFTEGWKTSLGGRTFTRKPDSDPGLMIDRLIKIQNDAKLQKAFLGSAHFEAGAESIIKRMILEPTGQEARTLADARKTVGYDTGVIDQVKKSLESGTPELKSANVQGQIQAVIEQSQVVGPDALFGEARKMRDELLTTYQRYSPRLKYDPFFGDVSSATAADVAATVSGGTGSQVSWFGHSKSMAQERLTQIEAKRDWTGFANPSLGKRTEAEMTAQERVDAQALRLMIGRFDELILTLKEVSKAAGQQTKATKDQTEAAKQNQQQSSKPAPLIPAAAARGMIGAGRER